jgi:hypothetical protein
MRTPPALEDLLVDPDVQNDELEELWGGRTVRSTSKGRE